MIDQALRGAGLMRVLILALALALTLLVVFVARERPEQVRPLAALVLGVGLVSVLLIALRRQEIAYLPGVPGFDNPHRLSLRPFMFIQTLRSNPAASQQVEILGNLILWVPVTTGATLFFKLSNLLTVPLIGILATGVEALQYVANRGRVASIDDVILALFGALVSILLLKAINRSKRTAQVNEHSLRG